MSSFVGNGVPVALPWLLVLPALHLIVLAHGAVPLAYEVMESPAHAQTVVAATSFGLLVSKDDGQDWKWVCDEAVGYGTTLQPYWHISKQGTLLGAGFHGLFISRDEGCTWLNHPAFALAPDGGQGTGASFVSSSDATLYAATGKYGVVNGTFRSTDDGATWQPLPVSSLGEFYTGIFAAPSRPQRLYVSAWWFRPAPTAALYWSDDSGAMFTRVDVTAALPKKGAFYTYAVDPTDPETLIGGLLEDADPRHSYVVRTRDRGATFTTLLETAEQLLSVALSDDGRTLLVATSDGVHRSTDSGATFTKLASPKRYACAAMFGARSYACGWPDFDGYAVARAVGGGELSPLLRWSSISGAKQCSQPGSITATCEALFEPLRATFLLLSAPVDAGVPDGGSGPELPPPPPAPGGCHCDGTGAVAGLALLAGLGALRRRR